MKGVIRYIIAATPRTGSGLLCEGLQSTKVAGNPVEIFAPKFRGVWQNFLALPPQASFDDFFHAAIRYGWTKNRVYGLKIQWMHIATLAEELGLANGRENLLPALFPNAAYINIVRQNRRKQAISWQRAITSDEWWRYRSSDGARLTAPTEPTFDPDAIRLIERKIDQQQRAWQRFFRLHGIKPLVVEYEDLAQNYAGEINRVLAFLGLSSIQTRHIAPPQLVKQADEFSSRWYEWMAHTLQPQASNV